MSDIVRARAILNELLFRKGSGLTRAQKRELAMAVGLMHRKFRGRATVQSRRFTPAMAKQIRAYVKAHPGAHYQAVATKFGVNIGRVTEAMGKA